MQLVIQTEKFKVLVETEVNDLIQGEKVCREKNNREELFNSSENWEILEVTSLTQATTFQLQERCYKVLQFLK